MSTVATDSDVLWSGTVPLEWTDYNGHLRDANYLLIVSLAGDALMERIGLGEQGRARTGHSIYTLQSHQSYLSELKADDEVQVRWQLLAADRKRLHLFFSVFKKGQQSPAAVAEQMWTNVDTSGPRSTPFDVSVQLHIDALVSAHAQRPRPALAGRMIALPA